MSPSRDSSRSAPPLRRDIRETAIRLFAKQGYAATGIREIAAACGISSAALYHYVGSKEEVLFGILHDGMRDQLALSSMAVAHADTPVERVEALVRAHVQIHATRRLEALVTDIELRALPKTRRREIIELRDEYEEMWRAAIADGVASGDFRVPDVKLGTYAAIELCTSVAKWFSPRGAYTAEQIADAYAGFVAALLRGDGPLPVVPGTSSQGRTDEALQG